MECCPSSHEPSIVTRPFGSMDHIDERYCVVIRNERYLQNHVSLKIPGIELDVALSIWDETCLGPLNE